MANPRNEAHAYYEEINNNCPTISKYSRNLNLLYLDGRLEHCYHRDIPITQIQKLLLRKNKANILLTGPSGCGKSALVEGLASILVERKIAYADTYAKAKKAYKSSVNRWKKQNCDKSADKNDENRDACPEFVEPLKPLLCDCVVYDLSLSALVGGTRYRGDLEERVQSVIDECKRNQNIVLFFDEVHRICKLGEGDNCESAAHMFKPALARNDIKVIGATTTEERVHIIKDKALARRFCEVQVDQLMGNAASETANNILNDYCKFHNVSTEVAAADLLAQVKYFLPHSVFPDNFINVVDETLAGAVFEGKNTVDITDFYAVLSRIVGKVIVRM